MEIYVLTERGENPIPRLEHFEPTSLRVEASNTIAEVKAQIQCLFNVSPYNQRLVFENNELEDDRTLADYNIQEKSSIFLEYCSSEIIQIVVKIYEGRTFPLNVGANDTIRRVKTLIERQEGIPSSRLRCIYAGNDRNDFYNIANVGREGTLHVVIRPLESD